MEYERLSQEDTPHIQKPNVWLWKRVSGQVEAKSLERIRRIKFLNMAEFSNKRTPGGLKDKRLIIDKDGSLKTADEYEQIPPDQNSLKLGNLPYFLKIAKIRETVYVSEGVCTIKTYKVWRNRLYKAGYTDPLLGTANRLLTTEELETDDQYFRDSFFETSSRKKISARGATEPCFLEPRLMLELLPQPVAFGHPGPAGGAG